MRRREDKKDARESGTTPHRKQQQRDTSKGWRELHEGRSEGTTSVTRRGEVDDVELHATNEVRLVLRYECEMCVNRGLHEEPQISKKKG